MNTKTSIQTIDTDFSKGRLNHIQTITLADVEKFHGHLCDGLVLGFLSLKEALQQIYPNAIIDRTNTRIVSKASPCTSDVAIYLTGGRYQFNTFYVSNEINYNYIVQQIDTGTAFGVKLKPGIKPPIIDEMGTKAIQQKLSPEELDKLKVLEDKFSKDLLSMNPREVFIIEEIKNFKWKPILSNQFVKTDVINKNIESCC
jgi:acetolactate decarboxylase